MRQAILIIGVVLFSSVAAAAQGPAGVGGNTRVGSGSFFPPTHWQVSVGYQYNRINLIGVPFNTEGASGSVVRFFGSWFGVEAQIGLGYGNTGLTTVPPNLSAKSLLVAAGPHLAYRGHGRFEPWIHGVVGEEHFRFGQTAGVLGSNNGLAGAVGGGLDFRVSTKVSIRFEADTFETHLFNDYQRHFQAVSGLVFHF